MDRFAGDVVPIAAGLVVGQNDQTIVESPGAEVVQPPVDKRGQTDPGVADQSKSDNIRLSVQIPLRDMIVGHLLDKEGQPVVTALEQQDQFTGIESAGGQRLAARRHAEAREMIGSLEMGSLEIERHRGRHEWAPFLLDHGEQDQIGQPSLREASRYGRGIVSQSPARAAIPGVAESWQTARGLEG